MYSYCMVCYRVTVSPYVRSVALSFHSYTLDDDSECTMDNELFLIPGVFSLNL